MCVQQLLCDIQREGKTHSCLVVGSSSTSTWTQDRMWSIQVSSSALITKHSMFTRTLIEQGFIYERSQLYMLILSSGCLQLRYLNKCRPFRGPSVCVCVCVRETLCYLKEHASSFTCFRPLTTNCIEYSLFYSVPFPKP